MRLKRVKGVILAAGLGTRLRPLTTYFPKPLIPFLGTNPLVLALWRFKQSGIEEIAINAHYMAEAIEALIVKNPFGQSLTYSFESEILGTGGVYNQLRDFQGEDDLIVYNGDIVSDIDLVHLVNTHRNAKAIATMALLAEVIPGETAVHATNGTVQAIGKKAVEGTSPHNFACAQIISRRLIDRLPLHGTFDIISKGYQPALAKGEKIAAMMHEGIWHDLRNPRCYLEAAFDALNRFAKNDDPLGLESCRLRSQLKTRLIAEAGDETSVCETTAPVLFDETASIAKDVCLGPHVILEPMVTISSGAHLERCIVLPGAQIPANSRHADEILGFEFGIKVDRSL